MLRTNTDLNPLEAMLCYKKLWTVEQTFRTAKHLLSTRPIFHKLDETIRGHVFCSFLALVLKKALEDRLAELGRVGSWPEIIADLAAVAKLVVAEMRLMLAPRLRESRDRRAVWVWNKNEGNKSDSVEDPTILDLIPREPQSTGVL